MKEKIIEYAYAIGLNKIGFAKDDDGNTVIVMLFPYYIKDDIAGNLPLYARGRDYHNVCGGKLEQMTAFLRGEGIDVLHSQADNGPLNDRKAAHGAGLGFYGRNGMLICEEYGSYFCIGQIVANVDVESDTKVREGCMECCECVKKCPGTALCGEKFDRAGCASNVSQTKGDLSAEQRGMIKAAGTIIGCEICQQVCPHNKDLPTTAMPEFLADRIAHLSMAELESMTDEEFAEMYKAYAFAWRGRETLLRNAAILETKTAPTQPATKSPATKHPKAPLSPHRPTSATGLR